MCLHRILPLVCLGIIGVPVAAQHASARIDVFGDPLPPAALCRMGTIRLRHGALVQDVQFIADGKWLMTGSHDNTVRIWDPQTGREVHRFVGRWGCLAPDGKTLMTWGYGFHAWDFASGKELPWSAATFEKAAPYGGAAAFTRDGKAIVLGGQASHSDDAKEDGKLKVRTFDLATGKLRSEWLGPRFNGDMHSYVIPGGEVIGFSFAHHYEPDDNLRLYDAATGKLLASCQHSINPGWSADGSRIVTQAPQPDGAKQRMHLLVYDAKSGKELFRHQGDTEMTAALTPDGSKVAFMDRYDNRAGKRILCIADVASGKILHALVCAAGQNHNLRFSANGAWLAVAQEGGNLQVWDVARGKLVRAIDSPLGGSGWRAEVSPDGKLLAAADGNTPVVHLWSLETGKKVPDSNAMDWGPHAMAFSHGGKKLATLTYDGIARVWDTASGKQLERLLKLASEDGEFLFEEPRLFWAGNGHLHMLAVARSAWPPGDSSKPALTIHLVDLTTGKPLRSFGKLNEGHHSWTVSADQGKLAAVLGDRIAVWDIQTGQERRSVPLTRAEAKPKLGVRDLDGFALGLAPNGKTLAVCDRIRVNALVRAFRPLDDLGAGFRQAAQRVLGKRHRPA
jgi:WD40 repeat protein